MIKFKRPKRFPITKLPSFSVQAWSKIQIHSEHFVVGTKCFRRHIGTNSDLKYSLYWLSPESSPHSSEDRSCHEAKCVSNTNQSFNDEKHENLFVPNKSVPDKKRSFKEGKREKLFVPNNSVPDTNQSFNDEKHENLFAPNKSVPHKNQSFNNEKREKLFIPNNSVPDTNQSFNDEKHENFFVPNQNIADTNQSFNDEKREKLFIPNNSVPDTNQSFNDEKHENFFVPNQNVPDTNQSFNDEKHENLFVPNNSVPDTNQSFNDEKHENLFVPNKNIADTNQSFNDEKREKLFIPKQSVPDTNESFNDEKRDKLFVPNQNVPDNCHPFKDEKHEKLFASHKNVPDIYTFQFMKTPEKRTMSKKFQDEERCFYGSSSTVAGAQQKSSGSLGDTSVQHRKNLWAIKRPTLPQNAYVVNFQKQRTESESSSYVSDSEKIMNPFISTKIAMHRRKYNKPVQYNLSSPRTYFYKKLKQPFFSSKTDTKTYFTETRLDLFTSGHNIFQLNRESARHLPFLDSFSYMLPDDSRSSSWNVHPRSTILPVVQAFHIEKIRPP